MAELYTNLPGFTVDYKDRGLVVPQTNATTDKVILIGTAADGPKYEPIAVQSPNADVENIFGKPYVAVTTANGTTYTSNGTTLMLGANECFGAGCRNLALVRVGGTVATSAISAAVMGLDGYYAGSKYNEVEYKIDLTAYKFSIKKPATKGGGTMEFDLTADKTIAQLVDEVNGAVNNNVVVASVGTGTDAGIGIARSTLTATQGYGTYTTSFAGAGQLVVTSLTSPGTDISITLVAGAADTANTTVAVSTKDITVTLSTTGTTIDATVAEVADAINASTTAKALVVASTTGTTTALAEALTKKNLVATLAFKALTGGTDGPSTAVRADYIDAMYKELHTVYGILENYDGQIVVPLGVFADYTKTINSTVTNFGEQLANFCANCTERNSEIFGIISMSPTTDITQLGVKNRVATLMDDAITNKYWKTNITVDDADEDYFTNLEHVKDIETGTDKAVGHFISVIAMPEAGFNHLVIGNYFAPATAAYAGMISALPVESAPTGKAIPNVLKLRYKLSPPQLNDLTGKRFVTLKEVNKGIYVTDACTACDVTYDATGTLTFRSDYWRLSTLRIVFEAVSRVRKVSEAFIGEPNELPNQLSLETAVRAALNSMKPNALTNFRFNITASLQNKIDGDSFINLELVPALERRKIRVSVAIKAS